MLGVPQSIERLPALIDEHAKREQGRAADSVLTVSQDAIAVANVMGDEVDAALEHLCACGFKVRRRQVQKVDAMFAQDAFVVAIFRAKVDDCSDAVFRYEMRRAFDRKAAAEREMVGQPMEVRRPRRRSARHRILFIFFLSSIFFIFSVARLLLFP
jgi:hypothetical protein